MVERLKSWLFDKASAALLAVMLAMMTFVDFASKILSVASDGLLAAMLGLFLWQMRRHRQKG
jgi:hypothetical protein